MPVWRRRGRVLSAVLLVVVAGLCLRHFGYRIGLSFFTVKYGGSLLWGTMVYLLVRMFLIAASRYRIATVAEMVAITVELVRLIHTPWLDAFRDTLFGALLLGKVFSLWNIFAYSLGIVLAMSLERWFLSKKL
ncbi:MAG TPA: DUF2809 domain-containing protein [Rhizobium sp.]|nr:DUF2809 domain-containing protein [Rhizobium sp.]